MAAAAALDLGMRAGTVAEAPLPDPRAARGRDPFADAMALAAAQGGEDSDAAALQREGVRCSRRHHAVPTVTRLRRARF